MEQLTLELSIIVVLVLINGVFAMSEVALLSARRVRLEQRAHEGNKGARAALALLSDPNNFLSTVQIGVTMVGVFAGAFGGATLARQVQPALAPFLGAYSEQVAFGLVVAFITYLSLILGELVPKRIAINSPERISSLVARPMNMLARAGKPLVMLLSASTNLLLWLLRVKATTEPTVTEEEVRALIDQGTQSGVFDPREAKLLDAIFHLADRRVSALMTPRSEIEWIDVEKGVEVAVDVVLKSQLWRFPLCAGSLDRVVGVLNGKDLLCQKLKHGDSKDLRALAHPPILVPESMNCLRALEEMKQSPATIAFVIDEYGGVQGIFTTSDLLVAIAGDFHPSDVTEQPIVRRDDGSYLVDAAIDPIALKKLLKVKKLPNEDRFHTLAGFMMEHFREMPHVSDHFTWNGFRFEVVDMDGHRIDRVLISQVDDD
jgi:putative hemolysin